jgi:hypothetical protein
VDVPLDENRLQNARQWRRTRATLATLRFAEAIARAARCCGNPAYAALLEHPPANLVDGQSLRRLASCRNETLQADA